MVHSLIWRPCRRRISTCVVLVISATVVILGLLKARAKFFGILEIVQVLSTFSIGTYFPFEGDNFEGTTHDEIRLYSEKYGGESGDEIEPRISVSDAITGWKFESMTRNMRKYAAIRDKPDVGPKSGTLDRDKYYEGRNRTLNVHIVAHTHDDVGWLKTIDQYYNGWNNTIQVVNVREIITSVVEALLENNARTFTYVEQKFFNLWWDEQPYTVKKKVHDLVLRKQLTFVNGGWCMHDEATTHYMGMIDQTTLGHDFLKRNFNYVPKVGWQLDPFGHSATQASLMTHKLGFDALYFGRIDYQDLELRHASRACEGLWKVFEKDKGLEKLDDVDTTTDNHDGTVFWGLTGSFGGMYGPPSGYCFDINCGPDYVPLIDMNHTELLHSVTKFLMAIRRQSDRTQGDHIMITMGEDFQYQHAAVNFANLDLLIGTIMRSQEDPDPELDINSIFGPNFDAVNIFYSSPEYYTECKYNETVHGRLARSKAHISNETGEGSRSRSSHPLVRQNSEGSIRGTKDQVNSDSKLSRRLSTGNIEWTTKDDDFFPYSDCPHCFWTGYFTSRPSLKKFERVGSSFLMAARQIESVSLPRDVTDRIDSSWSSFSENAMHKLEDSIGVLQHHDGVSGTSKQHVAYDYAKRLQTGIDGVLPYVLEKLKRVFLGTKNARNYWNDMMFCQLLNETKCDVSKEATKDSNGNISSSSNLETVDLYVIIYNSLASYKDSFRAAQNSN